MAEYILVLLPSTQLEQNRETVTPLLYQYFHTESDILQYLVTCWTNEFQNFYISENILKRIDQIWSYKLDKSSPSDRVIAKGDNNIATEQIQLPYSCHCLWMVKTGAISGADLGQGIGWQLLASPISLKVVA